jgi:hypothetical protein
MGFNTFLLKINSIPKMFFVIDHLQVVIIDKVIGSVCMFFLKGLISNLELNSIVEGGKPRYSLIAISGHFLLLAKISDRLVLAIPIG